MNLLVKLLLGAEKMSDVVVKVFEEDAFSQRSPSLHVLDCQLARKRTCGSKHTVFEKLSRHFGCIECFTSDSVRLRVGYVECL